MDKKKRSCNYTSEEKCSLLELVNKFRDTLDNKGTNAEMTKKKRAAWNDIAHHYNELNSSGTRTWQQLRHLYENIKQRSKKNISIENGNQYCEKEKLNSLKKKLASQVLPLKNAYDVASSYFGDTEKEVEVEIKPEILDIMDQEAQVQDEHQELVYEECYDADPSTLIPHDQQISPSPARTTMVSKKIKVLEQRKMSESIKEKYFKTKLKNAQLEQRYLINKHKREINKHKLEVQILKLRLRKMLGEYRQ